MLDELHPQVSRCTEQTSSQSLRCYECGELIPPHQKHTLLFWGDEAEDLATRCCQKCSRLWELVTVLLPEDLPLAGKLRQALKDADYDCEFLLDLSAAAVLEILEGKFEPPQVELAQASCLLEVCSELGETVHVRILANQQEARRYYSGLFSHHSSAKYLPFYYYLPATRDQSRHELLKKPEWN